MQAKELFSIHTKQLVNHAEAVLALGQGTGAPPTEVDLDAVLTKAQRAIVELKTLADQAVKNEELTGILEDSLSALKGKGTIASTNQTSIGHSRRSLHQM